MARPVVSIVIPAWNAGNFLLEALRSVKEQKIGHGEYSYSIETLVVDDGSTDGSIDVAKSLYDDVVFLHQKNRGAPAARNKGLHAAKGEYIVFLDSDDILGHDYIFNQVKFLAMEDFNENISPVCNSQYFKSSPGDLNNFSIFENNPREDDSVFDVIRQILPISAPIHRRDNLIEVGGFYEPLRQGQERDLHLRLSILGVRFKQNNFIGLHIRQHSSIFRISNKSYAKIEPWHDFKRIERELELLEDYFGGEISNDCLSVVAQRFWAGGRRCIRANHRSEAKEYFARARSLCPDNFISGGKLYKASIKLVGPNLAERLRMMRP